MDTPTYLVAARQFGAEAIANGGGWRMPNRDERDDIAAYYDGAETWNDMPQEAKDAALKAWNEGIAAEKEYKRH